VPKEYNRLRAIPKSWVGELEMNFAQTRTRYLIDLDDAYLGYPLSLQYGLTLYADLLSEETKTEFNILISRVPKDRGSHKERLSYLKEIGIFANRAGERWRQDWICFLGLDMMDDYATISDEETIGNIREWMNPPTIRQETKSYEQAMSRYMRQFLFGKEEWSHVPTLHDFFSDPANWTTAGASHDKRLFYEFEGKQKLARPNKSNLGWAVDKEEILTKIKEEKPIKIKVFIKREHGKARAVAGVEDKSYWRQAYIFSWLKHRLRHNIYTPLFMQQEARIELDKIFLETTRGEHTNVPFDWPSFDWGVSKREIILFFKSLLSVLKPLEDIRQVRDLRYVIKKEITCIELGGEAYFNKEYITEWHKGMITGMGLTGVANTAISFSRAKICDEVRIQLFGELPAITKVLGDDNWLSFVLFRSAVQYLWVMRNILQREFNAKKFFIDSYRNDFLRRIAIRGKAILKPPARVIGGLIWRSPNKRPPLKGFIRANEQCATWNKARSRGLTLGRHPIMDISKGNEISIEQTERLLHTKSVDGGLAFYPYDGGKTYTIKPGTMESRVTIISKHRGLNIIEEITTPDMFQIIEENWKKRLNTEPLVAKTPTTVQEVYPAQEDTSFYPQLLETSPLAPKIYRANLKWYPSIREALPRMMLKDWSIAKEVLTAESWEIWQKVKNRSSRKVFNELFLWEGGGTPLIPFDEVWLNYFGGLFKNSALATVMNRSGRIKWNQIQAALSRVEDYLWALPSFLGVVVSS